MTGKRRRIHPPSLAELEAMAELDALDLREGEGAQLLGIVAALVEAAAAAEERETIRLERRPGRRDPGCRPAAGDDPYNAFVRRCRVEGAGDGPLAGRTVAVKDNIAVGGVPMTEGTFFPAWTPAEDAVVVERILDAGGTIVGTLNMDELGGGATGVMSSIGPARNPVDPGRSAGGSSGGAGSAVRSGAVDLALGVDQGGSGRIPAAFCGVVGVKATHGLVPSHGVGHIDHTIDHVTPLARSVGAAALLLEVVAGDDWRDPQWVRGAIETEHYTAAEAAGVGGMRIGVVEESVTGVDCDPAVTAGLDRAVEALESAGATVERFSLPIWSDGFATYQPLVAHLIANMIRSEGAGYGHSATWTSTACTRSRSRAGRARPSSIPTSSAGCWPTASCTSATTTSATARCRISACSCGAASARRSAAGICCSRPPCRCSRRSSCRAGATIDELLAHSPESVAFNTAPLNLSGHPALSVPTEWGRDGALPTAVQLIAPHFREHEAFRAAFALEAALGPFA